MLNTFQFTSVTCVVLNVNFTEALNNVDKTPTKQLRFNYSTIMYCVAVVQDCTNILYKYKFIIILLLIINNAGDDIPLSESEHTTLLLYKNAKLIALLNQTIIIVLVCLDLFTHLIAIRPVF